jgi:hypothetical protein
MTEVLSGTGGVIHEDVHDSNNMYVPDPSAGAPSRVCVEYVRPKIRFTVLDALAEKIAPGFFEPGGGFFSVPRTTEYDTDGAIQWLLQFRNKTQETEETLYEKMKYRALQPVYIEHHRHDTIGLRWRDAPEYDEDRRRRRQEGSNGYYGYSSVPAYQRLAAYRDVSRYFGVDIGALVERVAENDQETAHEMSYYLDDYASRGCVVSGRFYTAGEIVLESRSGCGVVCYCVGDNQIECKKEEDGYYLDDNKEDPLYIPTGEPCCKNCCEALTAECLACSAGLNLEEFCYLYPNTQNCPKYGDDTTNIIQGDVKEVQSDVKEVQSDLEDVQQTMGVINNGVGDIKGGVESMQGDMSTLLENMQALISKVEQSNCRSRRAQRSEL